MSHLLLLAAASAIAQTLQPGTLPAGWKPSGPDCTGVAEWQIHPYNSDLYILRESGCSHYEKPFLYLIFGEHTARDHRGRSTSYSLAAL